VLLDGNEVSGVTSYGKATGSQTTFISSQELLFTFPANPILNSTGHSIVQVITPVSNQGTTQTAGVYMHTETIAPGTYTIAKNSRQLERVITVTKTFAPGESGIVCAASGYPDRVCINYTNTTNAPVQLQPSIFSPTIIARPPFYGCGHCGIAIPGEQTIVDHGVVTSGDGFAINPLAP
jgi:hypothetical protein